MDSKEMMEKIEKKIRQGIAKFQNVYQLPADQVQIVFMLDEEEEVQFMTCVNNQLRHKVKLSDLIGKNMTNFLVRSHLTKVIKKFAIEQNSKDRSTNIIAGVNAKDELYMHLRRNHILIRKIEDPDELKI
jgi:hypothetical protein